MRTEGTKIFWISIRQGLLILLLFSFEVEEEIKERAKVKAKATKKED
jgi:hypothetical protein